MRTRVTLSVFVVVPLLISTAFVGAAADPAVTANDGQRVDTPAPTQSPAPSTGEATGASGSVETPAKPFIPSESISADSAISFPVDI